MLKIRFILAYAMEEVDRFNPGTSSIASRLKVPSHLSGVGHDQSTAMLVLQCPAIIVLKTSGEKTARIAGYPTVCTIKKQNSSLGRAAALEGYRVRSGCIFDV